MSLATVLAKPWKKWITLIKTRNVQTVQIQQSSIGNRFYTITTVCKCISLCMENPKFSAHSEKQTYYYIVINIAI